MNTSKLYQTLKLIQTIDSKLRLQQTLDQIRDSLSNLVNSPASTPHQSGLATALSNLALAGRALSIELTPSEQSLISEIGGAEFFDPAISDEVSSSVSSNALTPSVARDFVQGLATRRSQFLANVNSTVTGLESLNIGTGRKLSGPADVAFAIPRSIFDNRVDEFAKELKFISQMLQDVSEAVTGEVAPAELQELSTSEPTIVILAGVGVISAIAKAVNLFLAAWEKAERIRKLRQELADVGVKKQAYEELTEEITENVESVVVESTNLILKDYANDDGRKRELQTAVKQDLRRLFVQIERGLTVEFRTNEVDGAPKEEQNEIKNIAEIAQTIRFPEVLKGPMLLAGGNVIEGQIESLKYTKTSTEKKTVTRKTVAKGQAQ